MATYAHITPASALALPASSRRHLLAGLTGAAMAAGALVVAMPVDAAPDNQDAELLAACAHYERLEAAYQATGGTDADMVLPPGYHAAIRAVENITAVTLAGAQAKARAALTYYHDKRDWTSNGWGDDIMWSLVQDLAGMPAA